jgi:hypothetical protein
MSPIGGMSSIRATSWTCSLTWPTRLPQPLKGQAESYLIGWEYSTNDDFQDVVCVIRNVRLKK